jgi:hypothetical protein
LRLLRRGQQKMGNWEQDETTNLNGVGSSRVLEAAVKITS